MLRSIPRASFNVLRKDGRYHRLLSTTPKAGTIVIEEGAVSAEVDTVVAKQYVKDGVFNQDLSLEVFNIFAKVIEAERQTRYETKVAKFKIDGIEEPAAPLKGLSMADAVSTDGVRALRYMKESPVLRHMYVNNHLTGDNTKQRFNQNLKRNGIAPSLATYSAYSKEMNLTQFMDWQDGVDVIDVQSPTDQFHLIDAAVQAVALDGGLLCVASHSIQTIVANTSESMYRFYGSTPIKTKFPQEHAIRVLLHAIDAAANRYKRTIQPWLSYSRGNSIRVYVRVFKSASGSQLTLHNRAMLHCNTQCHSFFYNRLIDKNRLENAYWVEGGSLNEEPAAGIVATDAAADPLRLNGIHDEAAIDALFGGENDSPDADIEALFGASPTPRAKSNTKPPSTQSRAVDDAPYTRSRRPPTVLDLPELTGVPAHRWQTGGPVWVGPLHDQTVVDKLLGKFKGYDVTRVLRGVDGTTRVRKPATTKEQIALLSAVSDELKDVPFSYDLNMMCKVLQCCVPVMMEFLSAIQNAGYRVSTFHANHMLIKTDAPNHIMWDLVKDHAARNNYTPSANPEAQHIYNRPVTLKDVDYHLTSDIKRRFRKKK